MPDVQQKKKQKRASVAADVPVESPPKISEKARMAMTKGTPAAPDGAEAEFGPSGRSCICPASGE